MNSGGLYLPLRQIYSIPVRNHLAVFAAGNLEHKITYRRPYTAGLWIGSMSVFKEVFECTAILN